MPTVTAQVIADKAKTILQDATNTRWSVPELLGWINDGQREICIVRRDACSKLVSVTLTDGTRQALPVDGVLLLDVKRNAGANGTTYGTAIRRTQMELLDAFAPGWHAARTVTTIKHFMYDPRTPLVYFVYPPAKTGTQVEIEYAAIPADVSTITGTISISDEYTNALVDYVLFRAFSKDHEDENAMARATAHRQLFDAAIGNKTSADAGAASPANPKGA